MSQSSATVSRIETEASEWLVALSDRTVSVDQRARFEAWLRADPEHVRVYEAQKAAWSAVGNMRHLLNMTAASDSESPCSEERGRAVRVSQHARRFALAAVLLAVLVGGALLAQRPRLPGPQRQYETTTAQVEDIRLEDGTLVTLGASSQIRVSFGKMDRRVVLTRGQAFFEVTHDTDRPFYVTAGNTLVRVVGTKFDVHYGAQSVRVAVVEGRVEVSSSPSNLLTVPERIQHRSVLTAGEAAISAATGQIATADDLNTEDLGAWRQGRLIYVDARLRDVIADINRYYDGEIELADTAVGDMQLTTAFRADQIDRVLEVLESALPIQATRIDSHRIVLSEKAAKR